MDESLKNFAIGSLGAFLVLTVLAFTPLAIIPTALSLVTESVTFLWLFLMFFGAPFGGFIFLLIMTPRDQWISHSCGLAGIWIGALTGAIFGTKLAEALEWT